MPVSVETIETDQRQWPGRVLVTGVHGLCPGVRRALETYDNVLGEHPQDAIYSVGEPAHNTHIKNRYREQGVVFVNGVSEVPEGDTVLLGPHGTKQEEMQEAADRNLKVWDTTCSFVQIVQDSIRSATQHGDITIYLGKKGHPETEAARSMGDVIVVESEAEAVSYDLNRQIQERNGNVHFASQTTINADEAAKVAHSLKRQYSSLITLPWNESNVCFATRNRQKAVEYMTLWGASLVLVVGSSDSSNSTRLVELAQGQMSHQGYVKAELIDGIENLDLDILRGHQCVGLTAGASVKEEVFDQVLKAVAERCGVEPEIVNVYNRRGEPIDESKINFMRVQPPK